MPKAASEAAHWAQHVIPLPKRLEVRGSFTVRPEQACVTGRAARSPLMKTVRKRLRPLAAGAKDAPFTITLALCGGRRCPRELADQLASRPHAEQAYAIRTVRGRDRPGGFLLAAKAEVGLLYAVLTLTQLARPRGDGSLELPVCEVDDWPDLEERGLWGGNAGDDLEWMAERKMNVVEAHARLSVDEDGRPVAEAPPGLLERGARTGVRVVPVITHLEQLGAGGMLERYPGLAATPRPGEPLPTDYEPHLCMSQARTRRLVTGWMRQLLAPPEVTDLMVWLSEDLSPCWCKLCGGEEPYGLEVKLLVEAFGRAAGKSGKTLRLLTTQGSYAVNDRVLAAAPPEVKISYYDGGRTYDSSRRPMIYPLMEQAAASGRWLGVYPQLTNSWRTVFPFTGPQFIHARMAEFVDKGLACLVGYATPSNRYYESNITAAAEWAWNRGGRSPRQFARSCGVRAGVSDPDLFADWAMAIGEIGWDLAASRFVEGLIFDPARVRPNREDPIWDHGSFKESYPDLNSLADSADGASQCVEMARRLCCEESLAISQCVLGTLLFMTACRLLHSIVSLHPKGGPAPATRNALHMLRKSAAQMEQHIYQWGMKVAPTAPDALPSRFVDTVDVASWAATEVFEWARGQGLEDPDPDVRWRRIGGWMARDFASGPQAELMIDVTDEVKKGGAYGVGFEFESGAYGITIQQVELRVAGKAVAASGRDCHIGRWDRRADYWLDVPATAERDAERRLLIARVRGIPEDAPAGRRTSKGRVLIRRANRA